MMIFDVVQQALYIVQVTYNNTHPFMILSESGVDDYNTRTGEQLSIDRFRPNFIVSGCPAFDEDTWSELWIGDVKFSNIKPCQRYAINIGMNNHVDTEYYT